MAQWRGISVKMAAASSKHGEIINQAAWHENIAGVTSIMAGVKRRRQRASASAKRAACENQHEISESGINIVMA
jgi:hypothetical protein